MRGVLYALESLVRITNVIKSELILVCGVTFPKFRGDLSGGSGRNIFRDIKLIGIQK